MTSSKAWLSARWGNPYPLLSTTAETTAFLESELYQLASVRATYLGVRNEDW